MSSAKTAPAQSRLPNLLRIVRSAPALRIIAATAVLFALSPVLAANSLSSSALLGMLPFAAVLAIAAVGQTLVIQLRGIDLAVPGVFVLGSVIVARVTGGGDGHLGPALLLSLASCVVAGGVSGLLVVRFRVTPIVATLGMNSVVLGVILQITSGSGVDNEPAALTRFALGSFAGVQNIVLLTIGVLVIGVAVIRQTVVGRRFVLVGTSPGAAVAAGIPVRRYAISTYALAGFAYGLAGVFLAAYTGTSTLSSGTPYLLSTVAAVVLGGTGLTGGKGSLVGTAVAALFLTQLQQVITGLGATTAVQTIIQGAIIALAAARPALLSARGRTNFPFRRRRSPARPVPIEVSGARPVAGATRSEVTTKNSH